jgi:hypothetical protein
MEAAGAMVSVETFWDWEVTFWAVLLAESSILSSELLSVATIKALMPKAFKAYGVD